jgi:type IV pilus assembly protein PilM
MLSSRKNSTVVGLDVEAGSIAASEVTSNGEVRLGSTGIVPLGPGVTREGEVADADALAAALKELFAEHKLARNVRIGIANQRVIVRTMRLPLIEDRDEFEAAIRFQAASEIAMPLDQAVLDWQRLESEPSVTAANKMDVVVVAARRETVAGFSGAIRAAGLKPIGIDVSAFAMIRALASEVPAQVTDPAPVSYEDRTAAGEDAPSPVRPARLYCSLGDVTNLAVARDRSCLFTRVSPFGVEGIAQRLAERRELTLEHARQWLLHVGLDTPVEEIEGDPEILTAARETLEEGAAKLAGEIRLSLDYYGGQEGAVAVEEIVACGPGIAIGGLPERLERELGLALRAVRPAALGHLDDAEAARLTVSYGLGMEV